MARVERRYAIVGGGIVGHALAAFLGQTASVTIFEKRREYDTRQRYLQIQDLSEYLEVESLKELLHRFIGCLPIHLQTLFSPTADILVGRAQKTCDIQLIFAQTFVDNPNIRIEILEITTTNYQQTLHDFDFVFDCSGYHSIFRPLLQYPEALLQNCINEHCLIVSFQLIVANNEIPCNQECKFTKNLRNSYTVIPYLNGIIDEHDRQHVTCLVKLPEEDYNLLQNNRGMTLDTLKQRTPSIYESVTRFTDAYGDKLVPGSIEIIAIPLNYYMIDPPLFDNRILLIGDAAMGSPYFQSASNGIIEALAVNYFFQTVTDKYEATHKYIEFYMSLCDFVAGRTRDYATKREEDLTCLKILLRRYSQTNKSAFRDAAILLSDGLLNISMLS